MKRISVLIGCALAAATAAEAVDAGRVQAGRTVAQNICSECHVVAPYETGSVVSAAPSFESIANSPGMTSIALSAALQSPHPTMPDLILGEEDRADVVAYILSLKWPQGQN